MKTKIEIKSVFGKVLFEYEKVQKTHAGNKYERDYNALIEYAKVRFANDNNE